MLTCQQKKGDSNQCFFFFFKKNIANNWLLFLFCHLQRQHWRGASFLPEEHNDENDFIFNGLFYSVTVQSHPDNALVLKNDTLISKKWKVGEGAGIRSFTLKQLWARHESQTGIDF